MVTSVICCLALSVSILGADPAHGQSPPATSANPAADRCCAATERRLAKRRLPPEVREIPLLREIYRFVGANLDLMTQLPCFCGCDTLGHHSVADCFVEHLDDAGRAAWSPHGAGCGMCIGIARDAMRMQRQQMTAAEIRRHIETKYGKSRTTPASEASAPKEISPCDSSHVCCSRTQ